MPGPVLERGVLQAQRPSSRREQCVCARVVVVVVVTRNKETSLWDETWAVWKETEGLRLPWVRVAGEATS